jgi:uncharacterized delta-60 repeat protein
MMISIFKVTTTGAPMKSITTTTFALTLALVGCGDQAEPADVDATSPDAASPDAAIPDAPPPDGPAPFVPPTPFAVPLSAAGPDQLQSAAAGPGGTFFAAGYAAATLTGPRMVTVIHTSTTGPVAGFGTGGVATLPLTFRGGASEVDVAVQSTGKVIVTATVANAANPNDRDVAIARLNANGTLDASFGDNGVRILDWSTAHDNAGTLVGFDGVRAVAIGADDAIYLHGFARAAGTTSGGAPRTDTDFVVGKLTADGAVASSFGTDGRFALDLQQVNATPHALVVLPDGSLLAGGYANTPGLGSVQVVLFKLSATGALVPGFATGGVFHDLVLAAQTEIYGLALHGTHVVTAGYGRPSGDTNDWVSLRFDVATGARDLTWGGATNGAVLIDPTGQMVADNCRTGVALPGGATLLVGSAGPANLPAQDAAYAILDATGRLDTRYGDGAHTTALGANGNDQFWGAAVSGDHALLVGYQGGGATPTETNNDDAFGLLLPLR